MGVSTSEDLVSDICFKGNRIINEELLPSFADAFDRWFPMCIYNRLKEEKDTPQPDDDENVDT